MFTPNMQAMRQCIMSTTTGIDIAANDTTCRLHIATNSMSGTGSQHMTVCSDCCMLTTIMPRKSYNVDIRLDTHQSLTA